MTILLQPTRRHDPDAVLDYAIDWVAWLAEADDNDALSTCQWTVTGGTATLHSTATGGTPAATTAGVVTGTRAVVYVRTAAPGTVTLRCRVTSSAGRVDDRSVALVVGDR